MSDIVKAEALPVKVELTPKVVKDLICKDATDQELGLFLEICKRNQLDPFKREVYFIKYKKDTPATIVTGYETYLKRAEASGKWDGYKCWVEGTGTDLIAKIEVYRKDWTRPFYWETYYTEAVQTKFDGSPNTFWKNKPRTMLKKVCISQGIRLAFPDEVGGLPYTNDEMGADTTQYEVVDERDSAEATGRKPTSKAEPKTVETKKSQAKVEPPTEAPVTKIDIHKDKYGGTSPHKDKLYIDVPLGYLKSLTSSENWDRFSPVKQQGITDAIEYLVEKERKMTALINGTSDVEDAVIVEEEDDNAPIGKLTSYVPKPEETEIGFTKDGELVVDGQTDVERIKATEFAWSDKLAQRNWDIEDTRKGENPPEALMELVTEFFKVTTLFTPIEKEKIYEAIAKMKRNTSIAQYNQIKVVHNKRIKIAYGD